MREIENPHAGKFGNVFPISTKFSQEKPEADVSTPIFDSMIAERNRLNSISAYKSDLDFEAIKNLEVRLKKKMPRGGIIFKTGFKLANGHHECSKCHYAFELDTYGRGCVHNCIFCYAKDQLTLKGFWNKPQPMPLDINAIRKAFYTVFETDKNSQWREVLSKRIPLRIGSMSDSFMWMDQKYRISFELLRMLKFYRYPYLIFTRSDLVAHDDYMKVLDSKIGAVQFSLSGSDERINKLIEPGAPSVERRLKALTKLNQAGIYATVRLNPLFPTFPDGYFSDRTSVEERFGANIPKFNLFDIERSDEFIHRLKDAGATSFLAGFVRLNQTSISQISRATEVDFRQFFKPENYTNSGESHFTTAEISEYYKRLHESAERAGIRFSTCYIGNGIRDYFKYQEMWGNKKDCCDVLGRVADFKSTSQEVAWDIRIRHSKDKEAAEKMRTIESQLDSSSNPATEPIIDKKITQLLNYKGIAWDQKSPSPE